MTQSCFYKTYEALKVFPVVCWNGWQRWKWIGTWKKLGQHYFSQVLMLCLPKPQKESIIFSAP